MFHRAHLLDLLSEGIPKDRIHFGKRLISYEHSPIANTNGTQPIRQEVILHFSDGTSARADVLVGADGIKSTVRRQMFTDYALEEGLPMEEITDKYIEPAYTGSSAYRSLIPADELEKIRPDHSIFRAPQLVSKSINLSFLHWRLCSTTGKIKWACSFWLSGRELKLEQHLVVFRINEKQINMVAFISDWSKVGTRLAHEAVTPATQEELFHSFEDFEDEAQELFKVFSSLNRPWIRNPDRVT